MSAFYFSFALTVGGMILYHLSQKSILSEMNPFLVVIIAYVVGISSAFTFLEESRYRYQVESLIWVTTALCIVTLWSRVHALRSK